jgi:hypothetical protein
MEYLDCMEKGGEKEHEKEHEKLQRMFSDDAYQESHPLLCCMAVTYIYSGKLSILVTSYALANQPTQLWFR